MPWTRLAASLLTTGLLVATAACSGSDSDGGGDESAQASAPSAYCASVADSAEALSRIGSDPSMSTDDFAGTIEVVREVGAEAGDEAGEAWTTVADGLQQVHDGLTTAGIELGDLTKPKKIDQLKRKQRKALENAISAHLGMSEAMQTIVDDVESECGVALGES
ncbi:hypothetical protein CLV56_0043 [Mumia flava]|uniref:Uncharacterized protein n=1 Tax=Mumia flava TaxID=1348852 RepID=A0A0B2B7E8_9ACTN|nr:hypothetical protein [Mumia flava]PJJ55844.1 hypothetical protein CLV56_0043 [Mumia flava]